MIYNPILDLSNDEIICTCVTLAIATLHAQGIADSSDRTKDDWQYLRLAGMLMRMGVYLSRKQYVDVWYFRYGWI